VAAQHQYYTTTKWTGNLGTGTSDYRTYSRNHDITAPKKSAPILGSSDPSFRGDPTRYNPEEMLVASLSACHMLWMLHLCADAGITVTAT
jgi:organic hydroperoxide reductase OsmC/OhrA